MQFSFWLNTTKEIHKRIKKPCKDCGYCPYGDLVEEYPLRQTNNKISCKRFGHDCPVYYLAEKVTEERASTNKNANDKSKQH